MTGSPSFTISQSLLKCWSIESAMLSNHLILCCPFSFCLYSFSALGSLPVSQLFASGGQIIGASASASVLMNIQGWSLLGLTGLILQSQGFSSLFLHHNSKASVLWCSAFFMDQLSQPYMTTEKPIALTIQTFVSKVMSVLFNMLSRLVITSLPRSKGLLTSWLQSQSPLILESQKIKDVDVINMTYPVAPFVG